MSRRSLRRARGMSIIEVLVAMVIALFLLGAVASLFLVSKRSYNENERLARTGENARFALTVLLSGARRAGFFGEAPPADIDPDGSLGAVTGDCDAPAAAWDVDNHLFVTRADADGAALGCITDAIPGTDVIVMKSVSPRALSDGDRNDHDDDDGTIDSPEGLSAERAYVISNPVKGILFDGGDAMPSIEVGGEVAWGNAWEYRLEIYYIRNLAVPHLSRKVLAWNGVSMEIATEDVVEGIENLRVLVGQDNGDDGGVDAFLDAEDVDDWSRVPALKIDLLVRAIERDPQFGNPLRDSRTFTLGNDRFTLAGDGYRRFVTGSSVSLRNASLRIRGE